MLEEKERVVSLLKEVIKELGMTKKGHLRFNSSGFDYAGLSGSSGAIVAPGLCPRWELQLFYPVGESERSKVISFEIVTCDFQSEEQIKNCQRQYILCP